VPCSSLVSKGWIRHQVPAGSAVAGGIHELGWAKVRANPAAKGRAPTGRARIVPDKRDTQGWCHEITLARRVGGTVGRNSGWPIFPPAREMDLLHSGKRGTKLADQTLAATLVASICGVFLAMTGSMTSLRLRRPRVERYAAISTGRRGHRCGHETVAGPWVVSCVARAAAFPERAAP
jgi:hypothetical protein